MSIPITFNGVEYDIPEFRDTNYANELTQFFVAIPNGSLQPTAGLFTLLAEVDFGASYGVKSLYYKSRTANPAAAGQIRLARADTISFRNQANGADLAIGVDSSNLLQFAGANVFVFGTSLIADSDLGTSINATHLANGSVSNTEFQYLDGVTSAIQTQLDAKLNLSGGTMTGALGIGGAADASSLLTITSTTKGLLIPRMTTTQRNAVSSPATGLLIYNTTTNQYNSYDSTQWVALAMSGGGTVNAGTQYQLGYYAANGTTMSGLTAITASKALVSDANGLPVASTLTTTELQALHSLTISRALTSDGSGLVAVSAVTTTELGYVSGVTSAIQTQLDAKAVKALSNLASTAVNVDLVAGVSNTIDIGDSTHSWRSLYVGTSIKSGSTTLATTTELGYLTGVSSAIQTQLNLLAPKANPIFTGAISAPVGSVATPGLNFGDSGTGFYRVGANDIALATNGVKALEIDTSKIYPNLIIHATVDGTAALPAYGFQNDTSQNIGMYRVSEDILGFSAGGTLRASVVGTGTVGLQVNSGQLLAQNGTGAAPGLSFANDPDSGWFQNGANNVGLGLNGSEVLNISPTIFNLESLRLYCANGAVTTPSITFLNDSDTGFYSTADGAIRLASDGVATVKFTGATLQMVAATFTIENALGSNTAPAYAFSGDNNTGMYSAGADTINWATGGTARMSLDGTSLTLNRALYMGDGSVGSPSITFGSDTDTGIWRNGSGEMRFTCNGVTQYMISPNDTRWFASGVDKLNWNGTDFFPVDNAHKCGHTGGRWSEVWAVNGAIQTSMAETKTNIEYMEPEECKVPKAIYFNRPTDNHDAQQLGFEADILPEEAHPVINEETGERSREDVYTSSVIAMLCQAARNDYERFKANEARIAELEAKIAKLTGN